MAAQVSFWSKEKLLLLGGLSRVSLKDARQHQEDARKLLVDIGADPSENRKAVKATKRTQPFSDSISRRNYSASGIEERRVLMTESRDTATLGVLPEHQIY